MCRLLAVGILLSPRCKRTNEQGLHDTQQMMADQEFKRTLGNIELHKLRYGNYPSSLKALKFLSVWGFDRVRTDRISQAGLRLRIER